MRLPWVFKKSHLFYSSVQESDLLLRMFKIVIIDDNISLREGIKSRLGRRLKKDGRLFEIFSSDNGIEGLGYVYTLSPDLVIIDTTLPRYSGREVVEYIAQNKTIDNSKVIVVHQGDLQVKLPKDVVLINKNEGSFLDNLEAAALKVLGMMGSLGEVTFRERLEEALVDIANADDKLLYSHGAKYGLIKLFALLGIQFIESLLFTLLKLFVGDVGEGSIEQKEKDSSAFRIKAYPSLIVLYSIILIAIVKVSMVVGAPLVLTYFVSEPVQAATYTWDGEGATDNWSDCGNWSTNVCPTSIDSVVFDGTSTKNSTMDGGSGDTIVAITINAGYTGTIDLQSPLTVNSTFTQNAGTFTALSQTLDMNGAFVFSGGTFTASSGTTTLAGALTVSGTPIFNHNNGTFTFDGTAVTLACNNITFNLVTFNNTGTKTVNIDCSLPLGNNPTLSGGSAITLNGTLSGSGTLTKSTAGLMTFNAGATLSGFSGLNVVSLTVAGGTMDFSSYSTFTASSIVSVNSGSLALPSGSDLNNDLDINGGTFTAPSGNMTIARNFDFDGGTFAHNGGTVTFDSTTAGSIDCSSLSIAFNSVVFAHTTNIKTVTGGCDLPLGASPTLTGPVTMTGATLSGSGTLTMSPTSSTFRFNAGGALSGFTSLDVNNTLTISGATLDLSTYTLVDLSGSTSFSITSGTFTSPAGPGVMTATGTVNMSGGTFNQGTGTITVSGTLSAFGVVFNGSTGTLDLVGFSLSSGTFTAPSGAMFVSGSFVISGGTFNHNSGTVTFDGVTIATLTCNNVTFNLVTFNHFATKTVNSDCNLPLGNNPPLGGGEIDLAGTLTGTGTLTKVSGNLRTESTAVLSGFSALSLDSLFIEGTNLDLSSYTAVSTSRAFDVSQGGTFTGPTSAGMSVGHGINIADGTFNQASGGTTTVGRYLTMTSSPSAVFNGSNQDLDVSEDFQITAGTFNAPSGTIYLGGDGYVFEVNGGTFNHNNGTVVFDGTNQSIIGTTFNNFTKIITSPDTLTFPAGGTETILGTATIKGTAGNLLTLVSSNPGVQWMIDPQGTRDIEYVNVQDGNNTNATIIQLNGTSVNSGNNTNWNFGTPLVTNLGPTSSVNGAASTNNQPTFTFDISDVDVSDNVRFKIQVDNNSDFLSPEIDYTSALAPQGSFSFTTGQAAGTGSYSMGSAGQTLADGSYYWRVAGIDPTNEPPVYTAANGSNVAFIVDATVPTGGIEIVDGDGDNPLEVVLQITANGATQMIISENSNFAGTDWEAFATQKEFTLSDGSGTKTVYIKFRDGVNNESIVYSDSIIVIIESEEPPVSEPGEGPGEEPGEEPSEQPEFYSLDITVVDSDNDLVEDALVTIHLSDGSTKEATTDSDGVAHFEQIPPGEYILQVLHDGEEFEFSVVVEGENSNLHVRIILEKNVINTPAVMQAAAILTGLVLAVSMSTTLTAAVSSGGFILGSKSITEAVGRIGLFAGTMVKRKNKYWGIVYEENASKVVPFAIVRLYDLNKNFLEQQTSDLNGRYGFASQSQGQYIIEANVGGFEPVSKQVSLSQVGDVVEDLVLRRQVEGSSTFKKLYYYSKKELIEYFKIGLVLLSIAGLMFTLVVSVSYPTTLNLVLLALYFVLTLVNLITFVRSRLKKIGRVIDARTQGGVKGAIVRLANSAGNEVVITNARGDIKSMIKPGAYQVRVDKTGYQLVEKQVEIRSDGHLSEDISLG